MVDIESFEDAKKRNKYKERVFLNSGDEQLKDLANAIKKCRKGNRCHKLACSKCLRKYRKDYMAYYLPIWRDIQKDYPVYFVTVVCSVPAKFDKSSLVDFKQWLRTNLAFYGFDTVKLLGGVDYSLNQGRGYKYFSQHFHFLVCCLHIEAFKECLKKIFFTNDITPRPVHADPIKYEKDLKQSLNYTIPAFFEKRLSYKVVQRKHTKKYPMSPSQLRTIYSFLAPYAPEDIKISFNLEEPKSSSPDILPPKKYDG